MGRGLGIRAMNHGRRKTATREMLPKWLGERCKSIAWLTCKWSGGSLGEGWCKVKMGGWVWKKNREEDERTRLTRLTSLCSIRMESACEQRFFQIQESSLAVRMVQNGSLCFWICSLTEMPSLNVALCLAENPFFSITISYVCKSEKCPAWQSFVFAVVSE